MLSNCAMLLLCCTPIALTLTDTDSLQTPSEICGAQRLAWFRTGQVRPRNLYSFSIALHHPLSKSHTPAPIHHRNRQKHSPNTALTMPAFRVHVLIAGKRLVVPCGSGEQNFTWLAGICLHVMTHVLAPSLCLCSQSCPGEVEDRIGKLLLSKPPNVIGFELDGYSIDLERNNTAEQGAADGDQVTRYDVTESITMTRYALY